MLFRNMFSHYSVYKHLDSLNTFNTSNAFENFWWLLSCTLSHSPLNISDVTFQQRKLNIAEEKFAQILKNAKTKFI